MQIILIGISKKKEKQMKQIRFIVIAVLLLSVTTAYADCRLFAMTGKEGPLITPYNRIRMNDYLEELQEQGGYHNNGWGFIYYTNESMEIAGEMRSNESAQGSDEYDLAQQNLLWNLNPSLVMGHVRRATSGLINIPDPHPFIFNNNNIDYTFAHNGSVDKMELRNFIDDIDGEPGEVWLTEHPPNTYGHGDWSDMTDVDGYDEEGNHTYEPNGIPDVWDFYIVDSEIYFLWIMLNIHINDYNIVEGMHDALHQMWIPVDGVNYNFVFSDGIDIYAYRYWTPSDLDHDLYYFYSNVHKCWAVMSEFPNPYSVHMMPNNTLLYLSPTGTSVMFKYFLAESFRHCRTLNEKWNWEAFSVFPTTTSSGPEILEYFLDYGITNVENDHPYDLHAVYNYEFNYWTPTDFDLNDTNLFKINMDEATPEITESNVYYTEGVMRDPSLPNVTNIIAGQKYWLGYNLLPSQNIEFAFGEQWVNVEKVWAQDWFYDRQHQPRDAGDPQTPSNSTKGKNMEFGKGYVVIFHNSFDSFTWEYPTAPATRKDKKKETQYFSYEEKPTYEVVDIMSVEGEEDIVEIGIFQDGECKGAKVVDEFPLQLIAYTDGNGGELTFQVATDLRSVGSFEQYLVYDPLQSVYAEGTLKPRQKDLSIVMLGQGDYETFEIPEDMTLHSNIPNPFKPNTTISFNLKKENKIVLSVFNIKGQKLKVLKKAKLKAGDYSVVWDGTDETGKKMSSGIYLYKLTSKDEVQTRKMIMLK